MLKRMLCLLLALFLALALFGCKKEEPSEEPGDDPADEDDDPGYTYDPTVVVDGVIAGCDLVWTLYTDARLVISGEGDMTEFESVKEQNSDQPWYAVCGSIKKVEIKEGVTSLSPYAFKNCVSLESVTLASTITEIPYNCFENCTALKEVWGGANVQIIRENAFYKCPVLARIALSRAIRTVEYGAFGDACAMGLTIRFIGSEAEWKETRDALTLGVNNAAWEKPTLQYVEAN